MRLIHSALGCLVVMPACTPSDPSSSQSTSHTELATGTTTSSDAGTAATTSSSTATGQAAGQAGDVDIATDATDTGAAALLTAPDLSSLDIEGEVTAILPGSLAISTALTAAAVYDTPCSGSYGEDGDPAGPAAGTIQCAAAKLLADPERYTNVGQEGFLESIQMFAKVFKRSSASCAKPLVDGEKALTLPVIAETQEFACAKSIPTEEFVINLKAGMPQQFGSATTEELTQMMDGAIVNLYWGVQGEGTNQAERNMVSMMLMPAKSENDSSEHTAWWYQRSMADNKLILRSVGYNGEMTNRRYLAGNPDTHEFVLNYRWGNINAGSSVSIRGAGYSYGAGKHYLLQVKASGYQDADQNNITLDGTTTTNMCFDADSAQPVAAAACADLEASFAEQSALEFFTDADLPASTADLPIKAMTLR